MPQYATRTTQYQGSIMVDICDLDLIGSKLEQNGLVINLTKEYYQQQVIEQQEAQELLQKCDIANLVGDRIVKQALEMRLAKEISVKRIAGVPFLMIYKFQHR
ncbi:MAG: DUF424 family protein [Nitrososphaera sp.]|nr:DUF424 family protein [Candidatus Nitrososphaera gargensis]